MLTILLPKNITIILLIVAPCWLFACSSPPAKNTAPKLVVAEDNKRGQQNFEHLSAIVPSKQAIDQTDDNTANGNEPSEPPSIWQAIHTDFAFPTLDHAAIDRELSILLAHPDILRRNLKSALPLVEYVLSEVKHRNLPSELALIPFIESGYLLNARSPRRAKGLWQFMPATANSFGLQQTWWQDDTYNAILSTDAALNYLQSLHERFDDWIYALTAYNWGPARLARAISKSGDHNDGHPFFSLQLPRETQRYIPKLLAYKKLISQHEQYADVFPSTQNSTKLTKVHIDQQTSLAVIADISLLHATQIRAFNPGYKRWATPPNQRAVLLLPQQAAELVHNKLPTLSNKERMPWNFYRIKPGDTLSEIARKNRITTNALKKLNTIKGDRIIAGKLLKIPTL